MSTNPPSGYKVTAKAGEIPYAAFTEKGWTLEQIGEHLGRSPAAVAGLIKQALATLRTHFRVER